MRLANDKNYNFLYKEQCEKIPWLFRWGKVRFIVSLIIMGICFVVGMIFFALFNDSGEYVRIPSAPGYEMGFNVYNNNFIIVSIICFALIALIAGWMTLSKALEKRAFKKASELSNMIFLTERHKMELRWQEWKMENRDY